jgi:hypothetical protein
MAGMKKLINATGKDLSVILIVRKGDHPSESAGEVEVELSAAPEEESDQDDTSIQDVTYGNDSDIYLNGIDTKLLVDGAEISQRRITILRGSGLDNALNMNDTIEFLFDGERVLISVTNTDDESFSFECDKPITS